MADDLVWYVAFGSNLSSGRLQEYLDPVPPAAPPQGSVPVVLPHRLFFARASQNWDGGGTAFVDPAHDPDAGTLATAWLLRPDQFLGVLAGENGRRVAHVDLDVATLPARPGRSVSVVSGHYGLVLACVSPDERPAFTITTPAPEALNPPVERYLAYLVSGLVEVHGLSEVEARAYLDARTG